MAHINVRDFVGIGLDTNKLTAVSYVFAKDKDFLEIIDQSLNDRVNLEKWVSPLPKRPEDGEGYYSDLTKLYAKVKLHFGTFSSPWWVCEVTNQCKQNVVITKKNKNDVFTTATELGWKGAKDEEYKN